MYPSVQLLSKLNYFLNCMELIEIFQICKGELWYETVSVKRLNRKENWSKQQFKSHS